MSKLEDFVINENGVLIKYTGTETEVVIPDGVTEIYNYAFSNNRELRNVSIPSGVVRIGDGAFTYCWELEKVIVPAGVLSIGDYAFEDCRNLKKVELPDSIATIGFRPFQNCLKAQIDFPAEMANRQENFQIVNGELIRYTGPGGEVVIPPGISIIGDESFKMCIGLRSVVIPEGVTTIGNRAFSTCVNLRTALIPESVNQIHEGAFMNCFQLSEARLPESITVIRRSVFSGCTNLGISAISGHIRQIDADAFRCCDVLTDLIIPEGVTFVGSDAFADEDPYFQGTRLTASKLQTITIEGDNAKIEKKAFPVEKQGLVIKCSEKAFKKFDIKDREVLIVRMINGDTSLADSTIAVNEVAKKPSKYLYQMTMDNDEIVGAILQKAELTAYETDKLLEHMQKKKFSKSYLLLLNYKNRKFGSSDATEDLTLDVKEETTQDWKKIFKYEIIDGEVSIARYKSDVICVDVPAFIEGKPVTSIGKNAFKGKDKITDVNLPDSITVIGESAFEGCTAMIHCNLPAELRRIEKKAFAKCKQWDFPVFHEGIEYIGVNALADIPLGKDVYFYGKKTVIDIKPSNPMTFMLDMNWIYVVKGSKADKLLTEIEYNVSYIE